MALQNTRADSLRFKHTGAATHDAAQSNPDLSIGDHLASSLAVGLTATDLTPNLGACPMTINRIAGENGEGGGTLTATGVNDVTWAAPGGGAGPAVTILNGETRLIEDADPNLFIVITRDAATDMTSSASVTIVFVKPNVWGFDDVSTTEQAAGDDEYRCVGIENLNSATVKDIKVLLKTLGTRQTTDTTQLGASGSGTVATTGSFSTWPATGFAWISTSGDVERELIYYTSRTATVLTVPAVGRGLGETSAAAGTATDNIDAVPGIELGIEAPSSQPSGNFANPADEDTAPGGVTFSSPVNAADALAIGDLNLNQIHGIWMHRITPAGLTSQVNATQPFTITADAA